MQWYELIEDCGDGSCATRRYKTKEEAQAYIDNEENYYQGDGDISLVDTDSPYFWG